MFLITTRNSRKYDELKEKYDNLVKAYEERAEDLEKINDGFVEMLHRRNVLDELLTLQGQAGNWDHDEYMLGMYNGMELALSVMESRNPEYRTSEDALFAFNEKGECYKLKPEANFDADYSPTVKDAVLSEPDYNLTQDLRSFCWPEYDPNKQTLEEYRQMVEARWETEKDDPMPEM